MAKESKFPREKILTSLLTLEANKGHLKWKVSDLARMAKVSRPLIYFHLGPTKKEILNTCLGIFAENFYGLSPERKGMAEAGQMLESLLLTHRAFLEVPGLAILYLRSRSPHSALREDFIDLESRYAAKLGAALPHLNPLEIKAVHAIFHGLVTAPFANEEILRAAFSLLAPVLKAPKRE